MNTILTRSIIIIMCGATTAAFTAIAAPAVPPATVAAFSRALYPNGLLQRHNAITDADEQPEFVLAAEAALPETNRHVVVYAERLSRELPFDKIYSVHVAVVERHGESMRVMDRRNVTEEVGVFTEFPGNFLDLRALVTPVPPRNSGIVAVELWAILHGTGAIAEATHLFYGITSRGTLAPVLDLDTTYAIGRSGDVTSAMISTVTIGTKADRAEDVWVSSRAITWVMEGGAESPPDCGPVSISHYRFDGAKFEQTNVDGAAPAGTVVLPRLAVEETEACADS